MFNIDRVAGAIQLTRDGLLYGEVRETERHGTYEIKDFSGNSKFVIGEANAIREAKAMTRKSLKLFQ